MRLRNIDRLIFVSLYRLFPSILDAVVVVKPETVIRWHHLDGTASLANRDFGRLLVRTAEKWFSPVPRAQMKPQARAISPTWAENPQRRDSVAEKGGFEPSRPFISRSFCGLRAISIL